MVGEVKEYSTFQGASSYLFLPVYDDKIWSYERPHVMDLWLNDDDHQTLINSLLVLRVEFQNNHEASDPILRITVTASGAMW